MIYLFLLAHLIFILLIGRWAFFIFKDFKIPVTVHNLPIILLVGLGLFVTTYCSIYKPMYFIPTGILIGGIVFIINVIKIPNQINPSFVRNISMSLFCTMFWTEMIVVF